MLDSLPSPNLDSSTAPAPDQVPSRPAQTKRLSIQAQPSSVASPVDLSGGDCLVIPSAYPTTCELDASGPYSDYSCANMSPDRAASASSSLPFAPSIGSNAARTSHPTAGGVPRTIPYTTSLDEYTLSGQKAVDNPGGHIRFVDYHLEGTSTDALLAASSASNTTLLARIPVSKLGPFLTVVSARKVLAQHGVHVTKALKKEKLLEALSAHVCVGCSSFLTELCVVPSSAKLKVLRNERARKAKKVASDSSTPCHFVQTEDTFHPFPPAPVTKELEEAIVARACKRLRPEAFQEKGCAVCGMLTPFSNLTPLKSVKNHLNVLESAGCTRKERKSDKDKVKELSGPVIDYTCNSICNDCRSYIRKGAVPRYALAKGLWIGSVPPELRELRYIERILVAKVRHSVCWAKVSSGMRKMKANVVSFESPMPKIYSILPPPREDVEEVLAIMFTGPNKPTTETFSRTPFLVRRNHVARALRWLILNHCDYSNVELSQENLASYPENVPPVLVEYVKKGTNKSGADTSVWDVDEEDGTEEGECSFTVHGVTSSDIDTVSLDAVKARALHHLNNEGKFLNIGQGEKVSIWQNPQLYPQMFPWLFPYGLGGVGALEGLSSRMHKHRLLMYHDKRFQNEPNFPFVSFSHEQMMLTSTHGHISVDKPRFPEMANRLLSLDPLVLKTVTTRLINGERVKPQTEMEKNCWKVFHDLDCVMGKVEGSITTKKNMRAEVWSLVASCGSPSWYFTMSPADVRHPLCLYYAGDDTTYQPNISPYKDRLRAICRNPVAAARFFHYMVEVFIKDILGVGTDLGGAFGDVQAYYGTVEQQGRLTLHLHMIIWIKGSLSPQAMRQRILCDSAWQEAVVRWLESSHCGEFATGTHAEVTIRETNASQKPGHLDPTTEFPLPPPTGVCGLPRRLQPKRTNLETVPSVRLTDNPKPQEAADHVEVSPQDRHIASTVTSSRTHEFHDDKMDCSPPSDRACDVPRQGMILPKYGGPSDLRSVNPRPLAPCELTGANNGSYAFIPSCSTLEATHANQIDSSRQLDTTPSGVSSSSDIISGPSKALDDNVRGDDLDSCCCGHCTERSNWWEYFLTRFDGVLLRSNVHSCDRNINKDGTTNANQTYISCRDNKYKKCRARFPRPVHEETKVDASTGALVMKKGEPWINFVTRTASVVLGCNTDTTSLLSGTSVKAVIVYVTDYITKPGLKTHVMFDAIQTIISKNTELITGDLKAKERARQLMTRIINLISAKMELGAPMISLYLLGNPDHYTGHTFKPLFWRMYAIEAARPYQQEDVGDGEDKVVLMKKDGQYCEISFVFDYIYRPAQVSSLCVYEFIQRCSRRAIPKKSKGNSKLPKNTFAFDPRHPLAQTHSLHVRTESVETVVPNFLGLPLPRSDVGDREDYALTMLTLFQPWRSGRDLRGDTQCWADAFDASVFLPQFERIMSNFNLKYECLDARDDYRAQLANTPDFPLNNFASLLGSNYDAEEDVDISSDWAFDQRAADQHLDEPTTMSSWDKERLKATFAISAILHGLGWDRASVGSSELDYLAGRQRARFMPPVYWKNELLRMKQLALESRVAPSQETCVNVNVKTVPPSDRVFVADKKYLLRKTAPQTAEDANYLHDTTRLFELNYEQDKAFRIVANHSTDPYAERLNMYIGGMGGTGKSRVLEALKHFFSLRKETYKLIVVAPTGSVHHGF
ncbi:hypothetical protein D9611_002867 [Ephemerocybe angulata]|uniref:ATP-dependent DNA helicase n=1 Tax=Ephemerocybe angulata TaxID=980116 RepID=A0A8H5FHV4_9AGAR|nr:hypothetical protein D9611_002867 [Tulosesus angulatus]